MAVTKVLEREIKITKEGEITLDKEIVKKLKGKTLKLFFDGRKILILPKGSDLIDELYGRLGKECVKDYKFDIENERFKEGI